MVWMLKCSESVTGVSDSTRVTIFGDSDSTRFTLTKMVTRLESQSMTLDWSQSPFYKISEPLMDKPSSFTHTEMSTFLLQWWSKLAQIFCFASLVDDRWFDSFFS